MGRRVGRATANLALVAIGLAVMIWMDRHRPNLDANQAPFTLRGRVGEAVRGRDFALTVERISLARALEVPGSFSSAPTIKRETDGVWVLVSAQFEALHEPLSLPAGVGAPSLRTRDRTVYAHAGGRIPTTVPLLAGMSAVPKRPARGLLVFELPPAQLPGAVLVASRNVINQLDSELEIDLGLTDADVRSQLASLPATTLLERGRP